MIARRVAEPTGRTAAARTTGPLASGWTTRRAVRAAAVVVSLLAWDRVVGCGRGEDRPRIVIAGDPAVAAPVVGVVGDGADAPTGPVVTAHPEPDGLGGWRWVLDRTGVSAGPVTLVLVNPGPGGHELRVTDPSGRLVARVPRVPAGGQGRVTVDLSAGVHVLADELAWDDGTYADVGLRTTLVVR